MSLSESDLGEVRVLAGNRWPGYGELASSRDTWIEWRSSLNGFVLADVMYALIELSETHERFPSLAALLEECSKQRLKRHTDEMPKIKANTERRPSRDEVLATYASSVVAGYKPGQYERKAMELLGRGVNPGNAARAMVTMWTDPPGGSKKPGLAHVGIAIPEDE